MADADLLTWCDDLHQVKGNVSQIQATLFHVLSKTPTPGQYLSLCMALDPATPSSLPPSPKHIRDRVRLLLTSPHIKVAVRLKELLDQGALPTLDLLSKLNFKAPKIEPQLDHFLSHSPTAPASTVADIDTLTYPPPLPLISDQSLAIVAFTDKSYLTCAELIYPQSSNLHNAKLSVRGRALISMLLTTSLARAFPDNDESQLVVLRSHLMSDAMLAKFAIGYNMPSHCRHQIRAEQSNDVKLRIFANLFAGYVSAMVDDGLDLLAVIKWIDHLYGPAIDAANEPASANLAAAAELLLLYRNALLPLDSRQRAPLQYVQLERNPFVSRVYLGDTPLGTGTSSQSLAIAEARAAANTMACPDHVALLHQDIAMQGMAQAQSSHEPWQGSEDIDADYDSYEPSIQPNPTPLPAPYTPLHSKKLATGPLHPLLLPPPAYKPAPYSQVSYSAMKPAPYAPSQPAASASEPVDPNAKNSLYAVLGPLHLVPHYTSHRLGSGYKALIRVNNVTIGTGFDAAKKVARNRAAMDALQSMERQGQNLVFHGKVIEPGQPSEGTAPSQSQ